MTEKNKNVDVGVTNYGTDMLEQKSRGGQLDPADQPMTPELRKKVLATREPDDYRDNMKIYLLRGWQIAENAFDEVCGLIGVLVEANDPVEAVSRYCREQIAYEEQDTVRIVDSDKGIQVIEVDATFVGRGTIEEWHPADGVEHFGKVQIIVAKSKPCYVDWGKANESI